MVSESTPLSNLLNDYTNGQNNGGALNNDNHQDAATRTTVMSTNMQHGIELSASTDRFTGSIEAAAIALRLLLLKKLGRQGNSGDSKQKNKKSKASSLESPSRSMMFFCGRRRKSVKLNDSDPTFKTLYLGNVVTALPRGDGCLVKPLAAIFKHYQTSRQPPAEMQLTVTNSGLKARTAEQGVILYRVHRITHCAAPLDYPRFFAWIYRHETPSAAGGGGSNGSSSSRSGSGGGGGSSSGNASNARCETRCHAVLCSDEFTARQLSAALESRLSFVFQEWLRTKRARSQMLDSLSRHPELVAALPAMPTRRTLLSAGQKYRPPERRPPRSLSAIAESRIAEAEEEAELAASAEPTHHRHSELLAVLEDEFDAENFDDDHEDKDDDGEAFAQLSISDEVMVSPTEKRQPPPPPPRRRSDDHGGDGGCEVSNGHAR